VSGRITAIERAADGSPLTVYVDGRPVLEVSEEIARKLGLQVGKELSSAGTVSADAGSAGAGSVGGAEDAARRDSGALEEGGRERFGSYSEEVAAAREAALRLLAVRARSEREIRDRLRSKGYDPTAVDDVVQGLTSAGLLDDVSFARLWADERVRLRPVGPMRLRQELAAKGVPGDVADRVLAETFSAHDEVDLAVEAARKRARGAMGDRRERERLHAFLVRRGFTYEAVSQALRMLEAETDDAEADV
jgi:regulatory protein